MPSSLVTEAGGARGSRDRRNGGWVTRGPNEPRARGAAEACTTEQTSLGEGIRWDDRREELLRVDVLEGRVSRDRVDEGGALHSIRTYRVPGTVGAIAPVAGDEGWLLAAGRGFGYLTPDGSHRVLAEVAPSRTRMNDAACDPQGRFWAGTLADDHHSGGGALYRLDVTGETELMLSELTISNGLGWSPDVRTMYLVDSGPRVIYSFAFEPDRGTISGQRALVILREEVGSPDGMTTATEGWSEEQRRSEPAAGLVYRFDTGATGRPAAPFRPIRECGNA